MAESFESILTTADPRVADLARKAKALISKVMPDVVEVVWEK